MHGHPTPWGWLNRAIAVLPVGLWMPYQRYRELHLAHHRTEALTAPGEDTESFYCTRERWSRLPRVWRAVLSFNNTLLGRLTIGPPLAIGAFLRDEFATLGAPRRAALWLRHCAGVAVVLVWAVWVCGMPAWLYLLAVAWPGWSLTLLRSYHEHQPAADAAGRTNNMRAPAWLSLLYLNNNYHVAHHREPATPWYELPRRDGTTRWDDSYARLAARFWRVKDSPAHPFA